MYTGVMFVVFVAGVHIEREKWELKYDHKPMDTVYVKEIQQTPDSIKFTCPKCKREYKLTVNEYLK